MVAALLEPERLLMVRTKERRWVRCGLGRIMEGSWKDHGGIMEGSWRDHGGIMEGSWRDHGGIMEGSWRDHGGGSGVVSGLEGLGSRRGRGCAVVGAMWPAASRLEVECVMGVVCRERVWPE